MQRNERLEQDCKRAIGCIITEDLKNDSVTGLISVTDVKVTPDQKYAKVFVSVYDVKNKTSVVEALNKSSKFIRGCLSKRVKMRNTPEILFVIDDSLEYGAHMDEVFKNLKIN